MDRPPEEPGPAPPTNRKRRSRPWQLALGLLATAAFAWLFARGLDWDEVLRQMSRLSLGTVLLGMGFQAGSWTLRIARWWMLLRPAAPGLPLRACAGPFLGGMALNNVLPLRAGDALRVAGFCRQLQSPVMRVAGTLVVERVLDVAALAGVFFVCLLGASAGPLPPGMLSAIVWLVGACGVAVVAILFFPSLLPRLAARWEAAISGDGPRARRLRGRFPAAVRLVEGGLRHGAHFAEALAIGRSRTRVVALLGISVAAWILEGSLFAAVAAGLDTGAAPAGPWLALATGTLATTLPAAPGHLGTFDAFAAAGVAAYGASETAAAAFALVVHAILWTFSSVVGFTWLAFSAAGRRRRDGK